MNVEDKIRYHLMPIFHKLLVFKVILSQFKQVVGKWLTAGKELFVRSKTTVQRVASCIDNFCVGQSQFKNTRKNKIIRRFIDKEWPISPIFLRTFEVILADLSPLLETKMLYTFWETFVYRALRRAACMVRGKSLSSWVPSTCE